MDGVADLSNAENGRGFCIRAFDIPRRAPHDAAMTIGLVRRGYSASGGAESYLKRFALALRDVGHECVLFSSAGWPAAEWPHGEIVRVGGAENSPRAFADALAALRPREKCGWLFSLERVWDCDCYRAGDGVHRAWLERRARFEPPWCGWLRKTRRKHRELLALEARLFSPHERTPGTVIANSRMVRGEIARLFDFPLSRIAVIPNGLPPMREPAPEERGEMRRSLGLAEKDCAVLFAGSGWERKGLRFAMEGINRAARGGSVLLVAGRGNRRGLPRSGRTRFLGAVRDMPALLAACDVFLLPTIYDPFSNACLEALAAGLPVITTGANGFSEIIERGIEGEVLENPADIPAIAAALEKWGDPEKRRAVRARLRARGAEFSMERNVRATLALVGG